MPREAHSHDHAFTAAALNMSIQIVSATATNQETLDAPKPNVTVIAISMARDGVESIAGKLTTTEWCNLIGYCNTLRTLEYFLTHYFLK